MKLLICVDLQNDFIDGTLGTNEAKALVPKIIEKIKEEGAKLDTSIIFTKDTHLENYLQTQEGKNLPVPHCITGTYGWQINKDIFNAFQQYAFLHNSKGIFLKNTFGSMELAKGILEDASLFSEIELIGLCTGICVLSNAILIKAAVPEIKITVDASLCACVTPETHKTALNAMKLCQINVINE